MPVRRYGSSVSLKKLTEALHDESDATVDDSLSDEDSDDDANDKDDSYHNTPLAKRAKVFEKQKSKVVRRSKLIICTGHYRKAEMCA